MSVKKLIVKHDSAPHFVSQEFAFFVLIIFLKNIRILKRQGRHRSVVWKQSATFISCLQNGTREMDGLASLNKKKKHHFYGETNS